MIEFDQKLTHLDAQLAMMEGRQESITNEFKRELTVLSSDVGAAKVVTNTLVEDNVKLEGKIRVLQGIDINFSSFLLKIFVTMLKHLKNTHHYLLFCFFFILKANFIPAIFVFISAYIIEELSR